MHARSMQSLAVPDVMQPCGTRNSPGHSESKGGGGDALDVSQAIRQIKEQFLSQLARFLLCPRHAHYGSHAVPLAGRPLRRNGPTPVGLSSTCTPHLLY